LIRDPAGLISGIRRAHEEIRADVLRASEHASPEDLARVVTDGPGDTVFQIDRVSEDALVRRFEELA
jgi:hypothetical protein